jgi:energy-coupling factor transport system substrate-specific component
MSWQLPSFLILAAVLAGGFAWYERRRPPARVVALVAAMAALAVVGRLAFAAIPNVKPTTDIVLFAGYALGPIPGFAVGAITALVSNVFMGQGPWTAWQMAAWGGVGIAGAGLARAARGRELGRVQLAIACGVAGLAFGAVLDVYQWTLAARQDLDSYLAVSGSSLPYNLAHAIGNVAFCMLIGPVFIRSLRRYRRRFEVRWAAPAVAALLLAVTVALTAVPAQEARAASSPSAKALRYLARLQNKDGGFGGARGQSSNQLFTGWVALGVASARRNPRDVARRGGRAITTYLGRAGSLSDTGELERTILVLKASGLSPRSFGRRDLVAELMRRKGADGSWKANVALTAFGVMALRAAGAHAGGFSIQKATGYLERAQNGDGGFGFVPSAESDVDDTGAVLQALAAAGRGGRDPARRAVTYLRQIQGADGGFGQMKGRSSNTQSTAWAVQGLVAVGVRPESVGGDPIRYISRLQRKDGHVAYSRSSNQTPVWVTAQALTALRKRPFPLATVPRRKHKRKRAKSSVATGAAAGGGAGKGTSGKEKHGKPDPGRPDAGADVGAARVPRRQQPLEGGAPTAHAARTAGRDVDQAISPWLYAAGGGGALVIVGLVRRRLRSRRLRLG